MKYSPVASDLDNAIWSSTCTYCGAQPGELCRQRPRGRILPQILTTSIAHIARVHAGHAQLEAQRRAESNKDAFDSNGVPQTPTPQGPYET